MSLQKEAKAAGRTTAEYLRLYALEGFLLRLARSPHRDRFVLKGGVLLAAYGLRRPTTDIDGAALRTSNGLEDIRQFVVTVASTALQADLDDGLVFDLDNVTAQAIRDEDKYGGVRIRLVARLASAREPFHVDVNIGDPIWPEPTEIWMPRLLGQEIAQPRWASWRRKLRLTETLPEQFDRTLESLKDFANPVITDSISDQAAWDPVRRAWNPADPFG